MASPASTAPTTPNIDSPKVPSGGLLGRTSSLMKSKIPSVDSMTPSLLRRDSDKSPSSPPLDGVPEAAEKETEGGSGLLSNPLGRLTSAAGSFSLPSMPSTPNISLPSPNLSLPSLNANSLILPLNKLSLGGGDGHSSITSIDPSGMLETVLGTSASGAFGSVKDILSSVTGMTRVPGLRRLNRLQSRTSEVADDLLSQAVERRKQLWKLVVVAANGFAVPDSLFKFSGRGNSFVLSPPKRGTIPLQFVHRGPGTISNEWADAPCSAVGPGGLLDKLNQVIGTKYTLEEKPGLGECLQYAIDQDWDFGRAYGMLRAAWTSDFSTLLARWESLKEKDAQLRASALSDDAVVTPRIPPRRVWDLLSNRVLPFWAIADVDASELEAEDVAAEPPSPTNIPAKLWAVSHAWMAAEDRHFVESVINAYEWPLPIPKDTSLENVRIELLNMGAKYIWLDVLCLRQRVVVTPPDAEHVRSEALVQEKEDLRKAEWKLDVPTIGHVYQHDRYQTVVTYFNGLGRPFLMSPSIITGSLHWINRVWTLQETTPTWLPGGLTIALFDRTNHGEQVRPGLFEQVQRLVGVIALNPPDIYSVVGAVQDRSFSNAVDRVGSVGYLLRLATLPTYKEDEQVEDMWRRLVSHLTPKHRTDLLALYPYRGDSWARWAPSWYQLMLTKLPHAPRIPYDADELLAPDIPGAADARYGHRGYVIEGVRLHLTGRREGVLDITAKDGALHHFKMTTDHDQPIGADEYILVGIAQLKYWIIGVRKDKKEVDGETEYLVEKTNVIRVHNPDRENLRNLDPGLAKAKVFYN